MRWLTAILSMAVLAALGPTMANADTTSASAARYQGVVRLWHGDELPAPTEEGVVLDTGDRNLPLDMPLAQAARYAGARVQVTGLLRSGVLIPTEALQVLAEAGDTTSGGTTSPITAAAAAAKNVAVILINFSNNTAQPWTPAYAEDVMFDADNSNPSSIRAYYEESSDGAVTLSGAVLGWYTIAATDANCDYRTWAAQAQAAASSDALAQGLDLNLGSTYKVYAFPNTSCTWAGLGELPGDESWTDGYMALWVIGHELGHNFGVHHAATLSCNSVSGRVPLTARESDDCSYSEYGDPFTIMGNGTRTHESWQRSQLGYPMGTTVVTPTSTMDQTYSVTGLEPAADTSAVRLLRITRPTSPVSYLDVELRQAKAPFDTFSASDPVVNGISVRIGWSNSYRAQSKLLDAGLATSSFSDAALQAGQSIWDPVSGVRISLVSVSGGVATVRVQGDPDGAAPTSATNLVATPEALPRVVLTWSAASDDRTLAGYEIRRNNVKCITTRGLTISDTGAWTGCSGLQGGNNYTYSVIAYDISGKVAPAASVTVLVPPTDTIAPSVPDAPTVTATSATTATVTWNAATDNIGILNYDVMLNGSVVATTTGTNASFAGLTPSTTYAYTVRARDTSNNLSAQSAEGSATTLPAPGAPGIPTLTVSATSITVTWTAGSDALAYEVVRQYYDSKRKIWISTTLTTTASATTYLDSALKAGDYRYVVRSRSGSAYSSSVTSATATVTAITKTRR